MKLVFMTMFTGILLLCFAACGIVNPGSQPEDSSISTLVPTSGGEAYPPPLGAYPAFETGSQPLLPPGVLIYPELNDGDVIEWTNVAGLVYTGLVTKVVQTHDLKVYLTLEDGRTLLSTEPAIDDILRIVESCGEMCADIRVATE